MHIHSPEFREEFYALIRNDEIHTRLYSLHLLLLAEKLKNSETKTMGYKMWFGYRWALFRLNSRIMPLSFHQFSYAGFHSHLPEELFLTDFKYFLKNSNAKTYKQFNKVFKSENEDDFEDKLKEVIENVTFEGSEQAEKLSKKLSLYVIAHRNYLKSI